jgi:hypothetical protein
MLGRQQGLQVDFLATGGDINWAFICKYRKVWNLVLFSVGCKFVNDGFTVVLCQNPLFSFIEPSP